MGAAGRPAKMSGEFDNVGRICYNKNAIFRKDVPRVQPEAEEKSFQRGAGKGRKMKKTAFFSMIFGTI